MKSQRNQVIALVLLLIIWAVCWRLFIRVPRATIVAKPPNVKVIQGDTLLRTRFRKVRSEMDALYHYRLKPAPFDGQKNPFRIPLGLDVSSEAAAETTKAAADTTALEPVTPDYSEKLLKSALATLKIGGVFVMNGTAQLTIGGELHKEGDEFTARVPNATTGRIRLVLLRVKHLSATSVTIAMADSGPNGAEVRIRLN